MQTKFLNKNNNEKLILFFNGWGMNMSILEHINSENYDVLTFYNYDKQFNINIDVLENYKEIYLVAWSMGVWAAAVSLQGTDIKITKSIAINGTLRPIDNNFGIPISIFEGTINNFSERNKLKFDRRMLGSKENFDWYKSLKNKRENKEQLDELKLIHKNAINTSIDFTFDKIIIGKQDLIFPSNNQINFWKDKGESILIECPHFPFLKYNSWSDIIQ